MNDRIDERHFKQRYQGGIGAIGRQHGESWIIDGRSRRQRATLACSLIIHEEETAPGVLANRSTQTATENVLFHGRSRAPSPFLEILVGIQDIVAEKFVKIAVKGLSSRLENGVNVSAPVAPLAGIIE